MGSLDRITQHPNVSPSCKALECFRSKRLQFLNGSCDVINRFSAGYRITFKKKKIPTQRNKYFSTKDNLLLLLLIPSIIIIIVFTFLIFTSTFLHLPPATSITRRNIKRWREKNIRRRNLRRGVAVKRKKGSSKMGGIEMELHREIRRIKRRRAFVVFLLDDGEGGGTL